MDLWRGVCFSRRRAVLPLQGSLGAAFGHQDLGASKVRWWVASLTSGPGSCPVPAFCVHGGAVLAFGIPGLRGARLQSPERPVLLVTEGREELAFFSRPFSQKASLVPAV